MEKKQDPDPYQIVKDPEHGIKHTIILNTIVADLSYVPFSY